MTWLESRLLWAVAALGLLVMVGGFGYVKGREGKTAAVDAAVAKLTAQYQAASAKAASDALAKQAALQNQYAAIDAHHAQELQHAKQDAAAVIAGLRDGNLRLRRQWRGCEATASMSGAASGAAGPDAGADVRAASEDAVFRAVAADIKLHAEADAQIRALQAVVKTDRQ